MLNFLKCFGQIDLALQKFPLQSLVKSSQNKKELNDVTAALFLVSFSQLPAAKNTKNGAAVTSLGPSYFVTTLQNV